ncbi:M48 family metallopeptidase [bacterium]|uniref:Protease HtpX homolog n=2 Tax=Katanobacteria TaxID=422282 RepID=A0A2M7X4C6_UNCKA|nr:M48 family metallopeptidase [bacterium]PIP56767.1 MAG: zinc metalloprotease HtpX [candidate division WWE3 bacterium CG22_combo_CG10-13_8_21_14_all_39_12]PJA40997.1 MAG: zinc metalloprotease HtpX [candidate division WWE3 bacterium CG_4_9_14_3_um_filter_39_7]
MYEQIASNKRKSWIIMATFIVVIVGMGYVFDQALQAGYSLFIIAIIFAIFSSFTSYYFSDSISIAMSGAKEVSKSNEVRLYRIVENLSIATGITPPPKVYVIEDMAINAFATGRDPNHAAVAVTRGALVKLEDLELEGVIAHEMSHIKNYDIRTMAIAVVLVGIIAMAGELFIRSQFFRGGDRKEGNGLMMVFAIIGAILAPLMAQLLKMALSRQREFLADASAVNITRYPEGLARALEKIAGDPDPLDHANSATAHLYISNPLKKRGEKISNMFSTHPPIEERIARLRSM